MEVKLRLGELREAAAQYGQKLGRAPPGAKGKIAPDTLLRQGDGQLLVDTPFLTSGVEILTGSWNGVISVQPKAFSEMLVACVKLWKDVGGDKAEASLIYADGLLIVRWSDGKSLHRTMSKPSA